MVRPMGSEIISVIDRRRWPAEEKLKILVEAVKPGASVTAVSERHGFGCSLVYKWLLSRARKANAGPVDRAGG